MGLRPRSLIVPLAAAALVLGSCTAGPSSTPEPGSTPGFASPSSAGAGTNEPRTPATPPSSGTPPGGIRPTAYTTTVVHHGSDHPDDLALDPTGALIYSDYTNGTISRLRPDGTAQVLHRGLDGPEGLVPLHDGTLIVAEENTNRVLAFATGASTPRVVLRLPGRPTTQTCHQGVDGIAWDARTSTLVVPDPVTGTIYRLTTDGRQLNRLATGFVHPVGAAVDAQGRIYVADECGGDVWRLEAGGRRTRVARAVMPDDVALDGRGDLLVTDVRHTRHDIRAWPLRGGSPVTVARAGLVEPQGLLVTSTGEIWISDDVAKVIVRATSAT